MAKKGFKNIEINRRTLLVGGGSAGLLIAWGLWPREYRPNLRAAPGETLFNAFLKIGIDGRVIVAVPQVEIGQGVYTSLPQILADELGADWRTVAVETAPISPLYTNPLLADEIAGIGIFEGIKYWITQDYPMRGDLMMTGGSTSIRAFEKRMRDAGAAARTLLVKAAAARWDVDWEDLDAAQGFVFHEEKKLSFAELAVEAATFDLPDNIPIRGGNENRLIGQELPRIDLPAKVDGSATFAGDVRLPNMVYASVRQGPRGNSYLIRINRAAAKTIPGIIAIFQKSRWAGAAATNWWAANQAVQKMNPVFEIKNALANSPAIDAALIKAIEKDDGYRIYSEGDAEEELKAPDTIRADYSVGLAPNAPIETLTATARLTDGKLEIWAPTQAPGLVRRVAARTAGVPEDQVTIYPMLIGGGYGRKLEMAAIEQVVEMAMELKRPVQLTWSRFEELAQDTFRPPARASLAARLMDNGMILGWQAKIAAPSTRLEVTARLGQGATRDCAKKDKSAVAGAVPPYTINAVAIDHLPVDIGLDTGLWRSSAHSYTAFFTESFIDELARKTNLDPLSFRMQILGDNVRLARALSTVAALGGWDGGASGSIMGIAAHSAFGSHIAILVEIEIDAAQRIKVNRAVAVVDCGRVINPNIVRQLIEGGIIHGISGATSNPITIKDGFPDQRTLGSLALPRLADSPEVTVEILPSEEEPGGITELAVPPVAPAIANALFALTGKRLRDLPMSLRNAK
jgi:isoquinoline 1-oxidoreductase beta subunit